MNATVDSKRDQIRRVLQLPPAVTAVEAAVTADESDAAAREFEESVARYLRRASMGFDLTRNVEVWIKAAAAAAIAAAAAVTVAAVAAAVVATGFVTLELS